MIDDRFLGAARVSAVATLALGALVVSGWIFDLTLAKSVLPGMVTMKMNTATSFVCAGASLFLQLGPQQPRRAWAARICALVVGATGCLTLLEYALHVDLHIDELLMSAPTGELNTSSPGRMAPNTALGFACAGTSLAILDARTPALRWLGHALSIQLLILGYIAVTGYALSVTALYGVDGYSSMALHTSFGLVVLAMGLLAARPRFGLVAIFAQDNQAGANIRRLLPVILGAPLAVAGLRLRGQHAGLFGIEFGLALTVTASTVIFAALALWSARAQGIAAAELEHARDQFRLALEAAPTGMLVVDRAGKIVLVNSQVEKLFGYSRDELIAKDIELLVPTKLRELHAGRRDAFWASPETRIMGQGRELSGARKDGTELSLEVGLNPFVTSQDTFVLSSIVDTSARKHAERERNELLGRLTELNAALERRVEERTTALATTLQERELLLKEVHHRVKNNLAVIVGLMDMQSRLLPPGESRDALQDCQGRVHAIALIHEKLHQTKNFADIPFATYIRGLANDVRQATGVVPSAVSLAFAVDEVAVSLDKAVPCGLILNELVTNAMKHAFPSARSGTIRVELSRSGTDQVRLAVIDDGVGLPAGLEVETAPSLGLRLVTTLTEQLDGQLTIQRQPGASFVLTFPTGT